MVGTCIGMKLTFLPFSKLETKRVIIPREAMYENRDNTWDTPVFSILKRLIVQFPIPCKRMSFEILWDRKGGLYSRLRIPCSSPVDNADCIPLVMTSVGKLEKQSGYSNEAADRRDDEVEVDAVA